MAGGVRKSARSKYRSSADGDEDDGVRQVKPPLKVRKEKRRDENLIRIIGFNLKAFVGIGIVASVIIVVLVNSITNPLENGGRLRVVMPFPAPKLMDLPQFQGDHKESLYWGTYRPHVYLGIRARTPRSLVAGLMWIGIKDGRLFMRHVCQDGDGLDKYGWTRHNGRDYGFQTVIDQDLILTTSFLKTKRDGSAYGGDWAVQVDLQSKKSQWNDEMGGVAHLFFYMADEEENTLSLDRDAIDIQQSSLLAKGSRKDVGNWQLHLDSQVQGILDVHYSGFRTPHIHNLSDLVQESLAVQARKFNRLQLPDTLEKSSNILVFQISGRVPFKANLAFVSGTGTNQSNVDQRMGSLTGAHLDSQLSEKQKEFDEKFDISYNLNDKLDEDSVVVGKAAIANMLGGIGYFYGQSKISLPTNSGPNSNDNFIMYWPAELYTAVPSRSFFPRGFLWDEGFHQLLVWRWDIRICLDILGHWLDLMNIDGWIPREQILGAEALSKVPQEFVMQYPSNGNPPTLFLVISDLIQGLKANKFSASESKEIISFLDRAFVRLDAWFQWFNTTQSGKVKGSYYWHGRDNKTNRELNPKSLSSGLDDYPRASHPNEEERHIDLRCWMLLASDCMHSIGMILRKDNEIGKEYGLTAKLLSDFILLNEMHYDSRYGAYFDFGNHTEKVRLSWKETIDRNGSPSRELVRDVIDQPKLGFVPHIGYVSLFPFMAKLIPSDSTILERQLDMISNKSILWTKYGLRSLSRSSSVYMKRNTEHDPPYWRGPIWMNMNFLILSALHHYSQEDGPYKDRAQTIYSDLRSNLIRNVVRRYHETGYLWEQYDQKTGMGKGARPFTGWTSLIVLIMAEIYS
ncbi:hypothetical protein QQ045_031121 [Rhodiola kirilowii]